MPYLCFILRLFLNLNDIRNHEIAIQFYFIVEYFSFSIFFTEKIENDAIIMHSTFKNIELQLFSE